MNMNTRTKGHHMIQTMGLLYNVSNSVALAQSMLRQVTMVNNFGQVIEEHSVSAPIIATMRAVPDFDAAVSNFPESALYNRVPTHRSDERYTVALESLGEIAETKITGLMTATNAIASSVKAVVEQAGSLGESLKSQVMRDRLALESSDITDDEIYLLQTNSITDDAFGRIISGLEGFYDSVAPFNVDNLRANPEQISQELDGMSEMVKDMGQALGLELTATGLAETTKGEDFIATNGDFEQKGFTKAGLLFNLDRVDSLCDSLIALSERKDELSNAIVSEAADIPNTLDGDDVTYGANEHVTLLCCYATMLTKAVKETVVLTSDLLMAIDPITDSIAAGEAAIESIEVESEPVVEVKEEEAPVAE